jgi:hypothetical protein
VWLAGACEALADYEARKRQHAQNETPEVDDDQRHA